MRFTYVTLFPQLIEGYFQDSIMKRALQAGLFSFDFCDPRDYAANKHAKVDDTAAGGGAGMVMMSQPLFDVLAQFEDTTVIFPTPVGKPFTQNDAKRLARKKHIVFVSGRYEGIDERVIEHFADELFSIGDYVLTGGELPSLVMSDAIARNIDGVLGNRESLVTESFETYLLEAPSFTKPAVYEGMGTPSEFLKGNHSKITALKFALSTAKTQYFRPGQLIQHNKRTTYEK
ncbi:MAG: tRNA (guanosine(37)-N1)-methyltransferase TrmD [Campylobacterales bacterium]|nr:tRNA (guanosine(37)-N1)-methyltransferase TrmD [Campylobacterales bacterium]